MNVLIVGNSHAGPLRRGLNALQPQHASTDCRIRIWPLAGGHVLARPFFVEADGRARLTHPAITAPFKVLPPMAQVFDSYGFSGPLHTARVFRHPDWQRFDLNVPADGAPVSSALMRRLALDDQGPMLQLIQIFLRRRLPVFVVESPRPFRHHAAVARLGSRKVAQIDLAYRTTIKRWLADHGVPCIEVPADTVDADGFTLDAFRHENPSDEHHGNPAFAQKMMQKIFAALKLEVQDPPVADAAQ